MEQSKQEKRRCSKHKRYTGRVKPQKLCVPCWWIFLVEADDVLKKVKYLGKEWVVAVHHRGNR